MSPEQRILLERATEKLLLGPKRSPSSGMCGWLSPAHPGRCLLLHERHPGSSWGSGNRQSTIVLSALKEKQKAKPATWFLVQAICVWAGKSRLTSNPRFTGKRTSKTTSHQQTRSPNPPSPNMPMWATPLLSHMNTTASTSDSWVTRCMLRSFHLHISGKF